jgi:hypothetical protein
MPEIPPTRDINALRHELAERQEAMHADPYDIDKLIDWHHTFFELLKTGGRTTPDQYKPTDVF